MRSISEKFRKNIRALKPRVLRDTSGAAAVVIALSMPVTIGGLGLGAETGYWYFSQRKVQNAADIAAYAGAVALRSGRSTTEIGTAALDGANDTGFMQARGVIATNTPPLTGAFAGDAQAVEVILREDLPRMFTAIYSDDDVPVSGRAVAQITAGSQTCVLALDPSAPGAVTFIGNSGTLLVGCSVHSNSLATDSVIVTGSAAVETPCVSAGGGVNADSGLLMTVCSSPYENADVVPDPYADIPVPTAVLGEGCKANNTFGGAATATYSITGGRYCNGMKVQRTVNMAPGVYVVDGGTLDITSTAKIYGTGVTFYLTNGATVKMNGTAEAQLVAPNSGDYSGVLMFVDRNEPYNTHTINGNLASKVNGAIYSASGKVEFLGGSTVAGGCTQVVARSITFSGNAKVGVDCTTSGVRDIRTARLIKLVE
jgi:hypothetical protein